MSNKINLSKEQFAAITVPQVRALFNRSTVKADRIDFRGKQVFTGVYIFTNRITNQSYVGQSRNIIERLRYHSKALQPSMPLHVAIQEYGLHVFSITVIPAPEEALEQLEEMLIASMNTLYPHGYNKYLGNHKVTTELFWQARRAAGLI